MLTALVIQGRNIMTISNIQHPTIKLRTLLSIIFLLSSLLLSSCSSIISVSRDKPIGENYGKRTPGAYVDDQLIET